MKKSVRLTMINNSPYLVDSESTSTEGLAYFDADGVLFRIVATPEQIGWFSLGQTLEPSDSVMLSKNTWYHRVNESHLQKIINNNNQCSISVYDNGKIKTVAGRVLIEL